MAKKSYCIIDDKKQTVTFVVDKLTKKEAENLKILNAIGYDLVRTTAEELYPSKNLYTKENVEKFLKTKDKDIQKKFKEKQEEIATDENGVVKRFKNGNPRKKGYINGLKWFKEEFKEEFLEFIEK